jgi:hypothetical protein
VNSASRKFISTNILEMASSFIAGTLGPIMKFWSQKVLSA